MLDFAKLYDHTRHGQILVKFDTHEDEGNPEIRFYARLPGMGVCSAAMGYTNDAAGWDKAESMFGKVNRDLAEKFMDQIAVLTEGAS